MYIFLDFYKFQLEASHNPSSENNNKIHNHNCQQSIHLSSVSCPLSLYLIFLSLSEYVQRIQEFPQNNIMGNAGFELSLQTPWKFKSVLLYQTVCETTTHYPKLQNLLYCIRVIHKVTLCFTPYLLCIWPLSPLSVVSAK